MYFNPSKCKFLRVTNSKKIIEFQYCIQSDIIQEVQQRVKYLGITINNKLSWSDHIHNVTSKVDSVIGFLHRNFHHCPIQTKSALYLILVRPNLEYVVNVLGTSPSIRLGCGNYAGIILSIMQRNVILV